MSFLAIPHARTQKPCSSPRPLSSVHTYVQEPCVAHPTGQLVSSDVSVYLLYLPWLAFRSVAFVSLFSTAVPPSQTRTSHHGPHTTKNFRCLKRGEPGMFSV